MRNWAHTYKKYTILNASINSKKSQEQGESKGKWNPQITSPFPPTLSHIYYVCLASDKSYFQKGRGVWFGFISSLGLYLLPATSTNASVRSWEALSIVLVRKPLSKIDSQKYPKCSPGSITYGSLRASSLVHFCSPHVIFPGVAQAPARPSLPLYSTAFFSVPPCQHLSLQPAWLEDTHKKTEELHSWVSRVLGIPLNYTLEGHRKTQVTAEQEPLPYWTWLCS